MELLRSERDGPVAVGGVPQHGEASPDLRDWNDLDALGWHGVYSHPGGAVTVVEQDLGEHTAEGVAHDDRRALQLAYDTLVVLHDCGDRQRLDRGGVLVQRLYLYLQAGVCWGEHMIATVLIALDPLLPAARSHPESVDQDDGVGGILGVPSHVYPFWLGFAGVAALSVPLFCGKGGQRLRRALFQWTSIETFTMWITCLLS